MNSHKLDAEIGKLYDECKEPNWDGYHANPVTHGHRLAALRFIKLLPFQHPPEVCADPDGCICFDWFGLDKNISVSVSKDGGLAYASHCDGYGNWGTDIIGPNGLSRPILLLIANTIGEAGWADLRATLPDTGLFAPPTDVEWVCASLLPWANLIAARYGHPVWLVGGVLRDKYPRDIDIRVILPDDEYKSRFGEWRHKGVWDDLGIRRWAATMGKENRWIAKHHGLNVDFQIQSVSEVAHHRYTDQPKRRLENVTQYEFRESTDEERAVANAVADGLMFGTQQPPVQAGGVSPA